MTLPVVVHADADDEITEAAIWYEARRPGLGLEFIAAIDRSVLEIGENPEQFQHGTHLGDASFFSASPSWCSMRSSKIASS